MLDCYQYLTWIINCNISVKVKLIQIIFHWSSYSNSLWNVPVWLLLWESPPALRRAADSVVLMWWWRRFPADLLGSITLRTADQSGEGAPARLNLRIRPPFLSLPCSPGDWLPPASSKGIIESLMTWWGPEEGHFPGPTLLMCGQTAQPRWPLNPTWPRYQQRLISV